MQYVKNSSSDVCSRYMSPFLVQNSNMSTWALTPVYSFVDQSKKLQKNGVFLFGISFFVLEI